MTDPIHNLTDAHLQAALDAAQSGYAVIDIRCCEADSEFRGIIACARQIAANEKLAAELAELRAKYEPEPVDPVKVIVDEITVKFNITAILEKQDDQ